jgi:putative transposase
VGFTGALLTPNIGLFIMATAPRTTAARTSRTCATSSTGPASASGASFVTLATYEHRPIFQVSRLAELFIETLLDYRRSGYYKLHAYLVMPDHVHLLISPESLPLDQAVCLIQKGFAHRIGMKETLWQERFVAHSIRSLRDLETVRTYLHQTPVRVHLTSIPELYPYSSAHRAS